MYVHYLLDHSTHYKRTPRTDAERLTLAISDFDGVHQGHRRLIAQTRRNARLLGAQAVALTFWPQPGIAVDFNGPQASAERLLTTLDERLELLAELADGGDDPPLTEVYIAPSTPAMERMLRSPDEVMAQCESWFGAGRITMAQCEIADVSGEPNEARETSAPYDTSSLIGAGPEHASHPPLASPAYPFVALAPTQQSSQAQEVEVIASLEQAEIGALIRSGRLVEATRRLGYAYRLHGEVGPGDQRGRLLGYPTANLRCDARKVLPENGIYAVRVRLPGERDFTHPGAANVGVRPTFTVEGTVPRRLVEIFLLDATIDLYGLTIGVEFVARLRAEMRFSGEHALDDLIAQMARDIEQTRQALA